jgi:hypothetical protein
VVVDYQPDNTSNRLQAVEGQNTVYLKPVFSDESAKGTLKIVSGNGEMFRITNDVSESVRGDKAILGSNFTIVMVTDMLKGQKIDRQFLVVEIDYGISHKKINVLVMPTNGQELAMPVELLNINGDICYGLIKDINQYDCTEFTTINVPEGVEAIKKVPFDDPSKDYDGNGFCNILDHGVLANAKELNLPSTLDEVDADCFLEETTHDMNSGVRDLKVCANTVLDIMVTSSKTNLWPNLKYCEIYGTNKYQTIDATRGVNFGFGSVTSLTIDNQIKTIIGANMTGGPFNGLGKMLPVNGTMVNLSENLIDMSGFVFDGAYLKYVVLPESLRILGDNVFVGAKCSNVLLDDALLSIGENCFSGVTLMESLTIPRNVNVIKTGAFAGCVDLKWISVDPLNNYFGLANNIGPNGSAVVRKIGGESKLTQDCGNIVGSLACGAVHMAAETGFSGLAAGCFKGSAITDVYFPEVISGNQMTFTGSDFDGCQNLANIYTNFATTDTIAGKSETTVFQGVKSVGVVFYNSLGFNPLSTFVAMGLPSQWTAQAV